MPVVQRSHLQRSARKQNEMTSLYSCLVYRVTNLGDMIQTLALSRLLPPVNAVFRHAMGRTKPGQLLVVNGFLDRNAPPQNIHNTLFAGVSGPYWRHRSYFAWLGKSSFPIGARDPKTAQRLIQNGLAVEMIGCATMTFPKYSGPRTGIYSVDYPGPGTSLTHFISRTMRVDEQWKLASEYLNLYRTAQAVYTSRLHVALPCLAMGTPVYIASPDRAPLRERFSLFDELGVPYGRLCEVDLSQWAERYRGFLAEHLQIPIVEREPIQPVLTESDRLSLGEQIQMARFDTQSWISKHLESAFHNLKLRLKKETKPR